MAKKKRKKQPPKPKKVTTDERAVGPGMAEAVAKIGKMLKQSKSK